MSKRFIITEQEKIVYTEENRKNWKGCNANNFSNIFNGAYGTKDYGYQKDYPEFGWVKFKGLLDGKNVQIDGCWDKFKIPLPFSKLCFVVDDFYFEAKRSKKYCSKINLADSESSPPSFLPAWLFLNSGSFSSTAEV